MITIELLTDLFGWLSVINISFLLITTVSLIIFQANITKIHAKLFALKDDELRKVYIQYLAQYKILIFVFNLAPYIALKILE